MTIRAIIFDYGEVLNVGTHDRDLEHRKVEAAARLGLQPDELWTHLFDCEASARWMTGTLSWDEFWSEVLAPFGISELAEVREFARWVLPETNHLNEEMVRLLGQLKDRYRLAVVSNASFKEEQLRKMLYNDFELPADTFDAVVTSSSVGAVKPDPKIFREVLARLAVAPEEAIFTDDMAQFTAAAAAMGMFAHTFTSPDEFRRYLATFGIDIE